MKKAIIILMSILINCAPVKESSSHKNKKVTVIGIPIQSVFDSGHGIIDQGAQVFVSKQETYYIEGLKLWPDSTIGNQVKVTGYLEKEKKPLYDIGGQTYPFSPDPDGYKRTIKEAKWELYKGKKGIDPLSLPLEEEGIK